MNRYKNDFFFQNQIHLIKFGQISMVKAKGNSLGQEPSYDKFPGVSASCGGPVLFKKKKKSLSFDLNGNNFMFPQIFILGMSEVIVL